MALEARQRPLLATGAGAAAVVGAAGGAEAMGAAGNPPAGEPAPTIYRVDRRWRTGVLALAGVLVAGLVLAAALAHML